MHAFTKKLVRHKKSTHPWLNDRVMKCVQAKNDSIGTEREKEETARCRQVMAEEHAAWTKQTRMDLANLPRGSKAWWVKVKELMHTKGRVSSIPSLKGASGEWVRNSRDKAELFSKTLAGKYAMAEAEENEHSMVLDVDMQTSGAILLSEATAEKLLES